jgi:hypothetical protein
MPHLTTRLLGAIACLGLTACLPTGGNGGGGGVIIIDGDAGDVGGGGGADTGGGPTTKTCSDGTVVPIEAPCNCPTSAADCDDGDPCTVETFTSGAQCGTCSSSIVNSCGAIDGCCPAVCSADNDSDCAGCGNGRVDPGETCDGDCDDLVDACAEAANACQRAVFSGDADSCDLACGYEEITACGLDDGCCPEGCSFGQDSDCDEEPILHGDACTFDPIFCEEESATGHCLMPSDFIGNGILISRNGVCTSLDCLSGTPCNNGTVCVELDGTGGLSACLRQCTTDNDCRRDDVSCQGPPDASQKFCL